MRRMNLTSVHSKDCRLHPSSDAAKKREELNGLDYREGRKKRKGDTLNHDLTRDPTILE